MFTESLLSLSLGSPCVMEMKLNSADQLLSDDQSAIGCSSSKVNFFEDLSESSEQNLTEVTIAM